MRMITISSVWKISACKYLGECYSLINKIPFQRSFRFTAKLRVKIVIYSLPPYMNNLTTINVPHSSGTFATTDESTLINHYHSNPSFTLRFTLDVHSIDFDKCIVTHIYHYSIVL